MITLTKEEAQQVLDAMIPYQQKVIATTKEYGVTVSVNNEIETAIETLRTRLAQPEPETCGYDETTGNCTQNPCCYPAPPQREWQGLTDEEIMSLLPGAVRLPPGWSETVRAIEAALRSKNT